MRGKEVNQKKQEDGGRGHIWPLRSGRVMDWSRVGNGNGKGGRERGRDYRLQITSFDTDEPERPERPGQSAVREGERGCITWIHSELRPCCLPTHYRRSTANRLPRPPSKAGPRIL